MEMVSRFFLFFLVLLLGTPGKLYSFSQAPWLAGVPPGDISLFEENGRVGLKNGQGQVLIPAKYEALGWSDGTLSMIDNVTGYQINGQWGLIHIDRREVTPALYERLVPGHGSLMVARKKISGTLRIRAGCIDPEGREVLPFQYEGIRLMSLRAVVTVREGSRYKHGLIDLENNVIIPILYKRIYPLGSLRYAVESFDNKTAVFTEAGHQLIDFVIDSLSAFRDDHAVFYQGNHQGVITRGGDVVVPAMYREVEIAEDGVVTGRRDHEWLFLDGSNNRLKTCGADSVAVVGKGRFCLYYGDRFWLSGDELVPLTPTGFSGLGPFARGRAVAVANNRAGVIDEDGQFVVTPQFFALETDGPYLRANQLVYNTPKWLVLDSLGQAITTRGYDSIGPWNGRFFPVRNRGFWGAVDGEGREIISCVHDALVQYKDDHLVVKFRGAYGIIGIDETWKVTPQKHPLELINDSLYFAKAPATTFLKAVGGGIIYFSDNRLEVKDDHLLEHLGTGAMWKIDFSGTIAERYELAADIEEMGGMSEGLRLIKRDGRYGFIDGEGRLRIANRYQAAENFSSSRAAVMIRGRWGFINHQDQIAVQPVFDVVGPFKGNFSIVQQEGQFGVVDKTGRMVLPTRYDSIARAGDNRFKLLKDGRWGLADGLGRMIVNIKYDALTDLNNGYVIVTRNSRYGLLTVEGVSTIPEIYDGLYYDAANDQYLALKRAARKVLTKI